jgi:hypothetical protein
MAYSKRRTFGVFFRFGPRQEVQTIPPVSAGGIVLSLAKPTMRFSRAGVFLQFHQMDAQVIYRFYYSGVITSRLVIER